jgi:hypothetical protein
MDCGGVEACVEWFATGWSWGGMYRYEMKRFTGVLMIWFPFESIACLLVCHICTSNNDETQMGAYFRARLSILSTEVFILGFEIEVLPLRRPF